MSRRKRNIKKRQRIVVSLVMIVAIVLSAVGIAYMTMTGISPIGGDGQGFFGLFEAGDYDTGVTADTTAIMFGELGVAGQGEMVTTPVFYRLIDATLGSVAEVEADGRFVVNANRRPEEWWIDPYMITEITGYWYDVYYKDENSQSWVKILGRTYIDGQRIVRQNDKEGTGLQPGWTMGLGPPPQFYDCNRMRFWVKTGVGNTPPYGSGCALKFELFCDVSWAAGTETRNNIKCASDEVYVAQQPPTAPAPPEGEPTVEQLTVHTTPGATVEVVGQGFKTADENGVATWANLPGKTYLISIQKAGYYHRTAYVTYPETAEITLMLAETGIPGGDTLTVVCYDGEAIMHLVDGRGRDKGYKTGYECIWTNLPGGTYTLTVSKQGYRPQTLEVSMPGAGVVYVDLRGETAAPPEEPEAPPEKPTYNQRPQVRTFTGPSTGSVGVECEFSATAYDAESDELFYKFVWGDGTNTGWLTTSFAKHVFRSEGTFMVTVQVYDGQLSSSSNPLRVAIGVSAGEGNALTTPLIDAGNMQKDVPSSAIVRVQTEADEDDFDLRVYIISPSGEYILDETVSRKTKTGNLYVSTVTFKCGEEGIVTIGAQAISKTAIYSDSLIMEKQIYCLPGAAEPYGGIRGLNETGQPTEEMPEMPGFEFIAVMMAFAIAAIVSCGKRKTIKR